MGERVTASTTAARTWVAEQLGHIDANVYLVAPETITPPAVILSPGDPWISPATYTRRAIGVTITIAVAATNLNTAALESLEALAITVLDTFPSAGVVSEPRVSSYAGAECLTADIPLSVTVE
jgi:hypothetical protein